MIFCCFLPRTSPAQPFVCSSRMATWGTSRCRGHSGACGRRSCSTRRSASPGARRKRPTSKRKPGKKPWNPWIGNVFNLFDDFGDFPDFEKVEITPVFVTECQRVSLSLCWIRWSANRRSWPLVLCTSNGRICSQTPPDLLPSGGSKPCTRMGWRWFQAECWWFQGGRKCREVCVFLRLDAVSSDAEECKICKVPSTETGSCFVVYRTVNVEQECRPMRTSWKDSLRRWVPMCCPVFMETWCCLVMERNDMSPYHMFFGCITLMSILWRIKVLMMMMIIIITTMMMMMMIIMVVIIIIIIIIIIIMVVIIIIIIMVVIMLMLPLVHIGLPRLPLPPRRNLPDQIGLWSQQLGIFQFGASDAHGFALQRATTWHSTLLLHATGAALAILVIFANSKNGLKWIVDSLYRWQGTHRTNSWHWKPSKKGPWFCEGKAGKYVWWMLIHMDPRLILSLLGLRLMKVASLSLWMVLLLPSPCTSRTPRCPRQHCHLPSTPIVIE